METCFKREREGGGEESHVQDQSERLRVKKMVRTKETRRQREGRETNMTREREKSDRQTRHRAR